MTDTKEIAKKIRTEVKKLGGKISVTFKSYSGGSSICVAVMEAPKTIRIKKHVSEISDMAFWNADNHHYKRDQVIKEQSGSYHQLNQYQMKEYDDDEWNNGVFLTREGFDFIKKINDIVKVYHWDKSDSSIDYFNCNFYYDITLGKWDKPFVDGIQPN